MLKDTQVNKKFGIPLRTLTHWKTLKGTWRERLYKYLKADASDFMAMLYLGEYTTPEKFKTNDLNLKDTVLELNTVFAYLDKIDTTQDVIRIKKQLDDLLSDQDNVYSLEEITKIVSLYNLQENFQKVFNSVITNSK